MDTECTTMLQLRAGWAATCGGTEKCGRRGSLSLGAWAGAVAAHPRSSSSLAQGAGQQHAVVTIPSGKLIDMTRNINGPICRAHDLL